MMLPAHGRHWGSPSPTPGEPQALQMQLRGLRGGCCEPPARRHRSLLLLPLPPEREKDSAHTPVPDGDRDDSDLNSKGNSSLCRELPSTGSALEPPSLSGGQVAPTGLCVTHQSQLPSRVSGSVQRAWSQRAPQRAQLFIEGLSEAPPALPGALRGAGVKPRVVTKALVVPAAHTALPRQGHSSATLLQLWGLSWAQGGCAPAAPVPLHWLQPGLGSARVPCRCRGSGMLWDRAQGRADPASLATAWIGLEVTLNPISAL